MKDILIKRNELKNKSTNLRTIKFDPNMKSSQTDRAIKEQSKVYNHWKFYDNFIKAREVTKK